MDRDGTRAGFDIPLTRAIADAVNVPLIASGGVGTLDHLVEGIRDGHATAVLAASIFHFGEFTIREAKNHMAQRRPRGASRLRREMSDDTFHAGRSRQDHRRARAAQTRRAPTRRRCLRLASAVRQEIRRRSRRSGDRCIGTRTVQLLPPRPPTSSTISSSCFVVLTFHCQMSWLS